MLFFSLFLIPIVPFSIYSLPYSPFLLSISLLLRPFSHISQKMLEGQSTLRNVKAVINNHRNQACDLMLLFRSFDHGFSFQPPAPTQLLHLKPTFCLLLHIRRPSFNLDPFSPSLFSLFCSSPTLLFWLQRCITHSSSLVSSPALSSIKMNGVTVCLLCSHII